MSEIINILTRTSNRPNYFKACCASIDSQTYSNINHIVGTDDPNSEAYITKHREDFLYIDPQKYKHSKNKTFWYGGNETPAWWNSYLNEMYKFVKDGWIMFLDDDDHFTSINSVSIISNHIKNEDTLFFWDVGFPGYTIPRHGSDLEVRPPAPANISMIGFMFHSKYIKDAQLEPWGAGDFRLSWNLWHKIKNKTHIHQTLTEIEHVGQFGNKQDKPQ